MGRDTLAHAHAASVVGPPAGARACVPLSAARANTGGAQVVPLSPSPIHMHQYTCSQAVDFLYLKNVLLRFLEIPPREVSTKSRLLPVLALLLKLSHDDELRVRDAIAQQAGAVSLRARALNTLASQELWGLVKASTHTQ